MGAIDTTLILNNQISSSAAMLPYVRGYNDPTYSIVYENGSEHRRSMWSKGKKTFRLKFTPFVQSDADSLFAFLKARRGSSATFYWKDIREYQVTNESCNPSTGDGTRTIFFTSEKFIKANTDAITVNNTAQTRGVDYTIDDSLGKITFSTAVSNGLSVKASYEFYVRLKLRTPEFEESMFSAGLFEYQLEVEEI
jgi:uncharacterized protein (TIGR02217 family)